MPNHVTNVVMSSPEVIAQLLDEQERPDFTQVCPYPERMEDSGDAINFMVERAVTNALDLLRDGDIDDTGEFDLSTLKGSRQLVEFECMVSNVKTTGFKHTREWNLGIWSTKWNAYGYKEEQSSDNKLVFDTAWSTPLNLLRELSANNIETPIVLMYADEDIGSNCGILVILGGNVIYSQQPCTHFTVGNSLHDKWTEFAIELKGLDCDDEDVRELNQIPVMHKIFRDSLPIGRLTPQVRKFLGYDGNHTPDKDFLTSLYSAVEHVENCLFINYSSEEVELHVRDHMKQSSQSSDYVQVNGRAVIELDRNALGTAFKELDSGLNYTTSINFLHTLLYCGAEGQNLARILTILLNFNRLISMVSQIHRPLNDERDFVQVCEWMATNRGVDCTLALDSFNQFVKGVVSFKDWAEAAQLPKSSLVPSVLGECQFIDFDASNLGYEQFHVFKSLCMLYQYRDVMQQVKNEVMYTDSVSGNTYQVTVSEDDIKCLA